MKAIANIYQKIFMQVWVLALSTLIFVCGILMLNDLRNYKYVAWTSAGSGTRQQLDEYGVSYLNVHMKSETEFIYTGDYYRLSGLRGLYLDSDSDYRVISGDVYLDVYVKKDGKRVFLQRIDSHEYSENFYDIAYGRSIEIVPRTENVKIQYPEWRIYVPILLFILTVPLMALSGYLIVTKIIEKVRKEKEAKKPVEL